MTGTALNDSAAFTTSTMIAVFKNCAANIFRATAEALADSLVCRSKDAKARSAVLSTMFTITTTADATTMNAFLPIKSVKIHGRGYTSPKVFEAH